jgi:serine protease AprX
MRQDFGTNGEHRSSGLWGKGSRGETRGNALWGRGGRGAIALFALVVSVIVPAAGVAGSQTSAVVPASLLARAQANPNGVFEVIVQADRGHSSNEVASAAQAEKAKIKRTFRSISGASVSLSGKAVLKLARHPHILSIVPDTKLELTDELLEPVTSVVEDTSGSSGDSSGSGSGDSSTSESSSDSSGSGSGDSSTSESSGESTESSTSSDSAEASASVEETETAPSAPAITSNYQNGEMWRESTHVDQLWNLIDPFTGLVLGPAPQAPAIAIVDSGIDASKAEDFGSRVVASVNFSSLSPGESGDSEGHGTMVAAIAAGASPLYPGVSPSSPIIDLRTSDAHGQSLTSDVIAAADWILANKERYNIRVANFSMAGAASTSFRFDPLDKAVERLWFSGIVVVAAAGNHGSASGAVDMSVAPGNDPFIITVGAVDQQQSADPYDDTVAPWSGHGYTMDGFSKPDMAAPGRYMVAAVPMSSTIPSTVPERVVAPGYMWMSGTSFAAPVVAGAAAQLLARHPDWGPDEVKGALMLTSAYLAGASSQSAGVGEIDAASAASLDFTPPNPNENFYAFVETDPATGLRTFNEASWSSALASNASWSSANWSSASWSSASWSSANWASASWSSANWSSDVSSMMSSAVNWSESTFSP